MIKRIAILIGLFILFPASTPADGNPAAFQLFPVPPIVAPVIITTSQATAVQRGNYQSAYVIIDIDTLEATQTVTVELQIQSPVDDSWITIDETAELSATSQHRYFIGAPLAAGQPTEMDVAFPEKWRMWIQLDDEVNDAELSIGVLPVGAF